MDFKNKYLKYKNKYINLKNQQKAGAGGERKSGEEDESKVTLISSDRYNFDVRIGVAEMSEFIKTMIIDEGEEGEEKLQEIPLPRVDSDTLAKVLEFCNYYVDNPKMIKVEYQIKIKKPLRSTDMSEVVNEWYAKFVNDLYEKDQDMFIKLINAAHYLDIYPLLDLLSAKVASIIMVDWIFEIADRLQYLQRSIICDYFTFDKLLLIKSNNQSNKIAETINRRVERMENIGIRVPEDCETLKDAVALVQWHTGRGKYAEYGETFNGKRFPTIALGKGEHQIDGNYLEFSSAMKIVGDREVARDEIVVLGGIRFNEGIQGNCHLQHLTLRQAKISGVYGRSSFTMEDVLVEQCGTSGVVAHGTGVVGRCTNVEVRQCGMSGVNAVDGASITLIGAKTTVHHNCTKGWRGVYGLFVYGTSSTIQLVSPLTKEQVSKDNGGGGNWGTDSRGDINQIKTISRTGMEDK